MTIRSIGGRLAIDRAGLAQRWGVSLGTLDLRIASGDPPAPIEEAAANRRQKWWWPLEEADRWMKGFEDRKRAALTHVDRSGDMDELLSPSEAARVLGYQRSGSLKPDFLDLADQVEELPSGRKRRRWRRATVWAYADSRTGKAGTGAPRGNVNRSGPARREIDYRGDPDELLNSTQAATTLGYQRPASLPRALREHADIVEEQRGGRKRRYWKRSTLWAFVDQRAAGRPGDSPVSPGQDGSPN